MEQDDFLHAIVSHQDGDEVIFVTLCAAGDFIRARADRPYL